MHTCAHARTHTHTQNAVNDTDRDWVVRLQAKDSRDCRPRQNLGGRPGTESPTELQQEPTILPTPCCQPLASRLSEMPVV